MRFTSRFWIVLFAMVFALAYAQGPGGGQGLQNGNRNGNGNGLCDGTGSQLDLNSTVVLEGPVTAVNVDTGVRYPSIVINQTQVKVAPAWFFLENDFEIQEGDTLRVVAAPSALATDPYLHALSIVNTLTGEEILLRDEAGRPLWISGRGRQQQMRDPRGNGAQNGGCVDPATIQVVNGTIDAVTLSAGIQQPTLVVNAGGQLVTLKIGPARVILSAGIELSPGDAITVRIATATCTGELIALSLTDKNAVTVILRNDDGSRAW